MNEEEVKNKLDATEFRLRDEELTNNILQKIKEMDMKIKFMHVCGTHQDTIVRYGLDELLTPLGVTVIQGPGCPVCVTSPREVEEAIFLCKKGITITSFGDMVHVPGQEVSLADLRAQGHNVQVVYSVDDAKKYAVEHPEEKVVFLGIGFETTIPATAVGLFGDIPDNFSVLSFHKIVPPALLAIASMGEVDIQGIIEPGHVSTIIGTKVYQPLADAGVPQVVAGFEPIDMLMAIYMLMKQVKDGRSEVENEYSRVVKEEGNPKAMALIDKIFETVDAKWRGFPVIPASGLELREEYSKHNARVKYADILKEFNDTVGELSEPKGCRCGEVLRGLIDSRECPLFAKVCSPKKPIGPCMVSHEGSCNILFRYQSRKNPKAND
jgi:hydrogenase expression/formation protein HypD